MRDVGVPHANFTEAHEALELVRRLARKYDFRADSVFPEGRWPGDTLVLGPLPSAQNVVETARPPFIDGNDNFGMTGNSGQSGC